MSVARAIAHRVLGRIRNGRLALVGPDGARLGFGPCGADLRAELEVRDPRFYGAVLSERGIGLGRSYADGWWESDDLVGVLRIAAREIRRLDPLRDRLAPLTLPAKRLATLRRRNTRRRARNHISAHYDLGNEMFETFLDRETMMYSSALFDTDAEPLADAQRAKLDRICTLLELGPADHMLEIGSGWGGLALHAAREYGCRVTTTTISAEQRVYAQARAAAEGLADRITVLGSDYRDLEGRFDKLVSIEMIEAVGWQYFDEYFRRCRDLLRPGGLFFLQAIAIEDAAYEAEKAGRSFANELIFPGGCLPSEEVIRRSLTEVGEMRVRWIDDISNSYALTLDHWRRRFAASEDRLERMGYDRRFRRLWDFWLAFSEAGFREGRIRDLQLLIEKPDVQSGMLTRATLPMAASAGIATRNGGGPGRIVSG